jgi:hypothetical protein
VEEHGEYRALVTEVGGGAAPVALPGDSPGSIFGAKNALALGALALVALAAGPAVACRLALVLALDVSGSVDAREYDLQVEGVARALGDAEVRSAILSDPGAPVEIAIFEWSGSRFQRQVVDWTTLGSPAAIDGVAGRLSRWSRIPAPEATGIGSAMQVAAGQLGDGPACWRQVLDISGDGKNNDWPSPRQVRESGALGQITVNALVIGSAPIRGETRAAGVAELVAYFHAEVLHGPGAFVETALGYEDYADAMKRKLLKELQTLIVGEAEARW